LGLLLNLRRRSLGRGFEATAQFRLDRLLPTGLRDGFFEAAVGEPIPRFDGYLVDGVAEGNQAGEGFEPFAADRLGEAPEEQAQTCHERLRQREDVTSSNSGSSARMGPSLRPMALFATVLGTLTIRAATAAPLPRGRADRRFVGQAQTLSS